MGVNTWIYGRAFLPAAVTLLFGCSNSGSSSGCSSTASTTFCSVDATATICPNRITLDCMGGATPDAKSQCTEAIKQGDEVVYCCTNNAGGGEGGKR